jgi:PAS domain S-box-containing protein
MKGGSRDARNRTGKWVRHLPAVLVACVGLLLSGLAFERVRGWETRQIAADLRVAAEDHASAVRHGIEDRLVEIDEVRSMVNAFGHVTREEFRDFVRTYVRRDGTSLLAVALIRRVPAAERSAYEKKVAREARGGFRITEPAAEGQMVPRRDRPEYFAVHYIEPLEGNEFALGLDVTSFPESEDAVNRARDTGEPVATAPMNLVQERDDQPGVVVYFPLYRRDVALDSIDSRRENLTGFVTGAFRIGDLVESSLAHRRPAGMDLHLYDISDPQKRALLYVHRSRLRTGGLGALAEPDGTVPPHRVAIDLPGRRWLVVATPIPAFIAARATWQPLFVLAVGLVLTAIAVLQLVVSRRRTFRLEHEISVRKESEAKLRESELRFRQLAENINEVFWITSADGREMVYVSPAYDEIWGRSSQVLYQHAEAWSDPIHPEEQARVRKSFAENGPAGRFDEEYRIIRPDGSIRWIRDRGFAIRDESGIVYRIAGIAEDITERKRSVEELEKARQAAEESSRVKGEFLANMSHEIRTPMTSILGFADLMREDGQLARRTKWRTALEAIGRNGRHLLRLIDDILDVSRIEAGKLQIEPLPCSPVELLDDVVSLFASRAEAKGLGFSVEYQGGMPRSIVTDPIRLRQILINLVSNAIKFTDDGAVAVRATVRRDSPGSGSLRVEVADTGEGISHEQLREVQEAFVRGGDSASRRPGGTGLGLTISRRLAEALGGRLEIESVPGEGTQVTVEVPTGPLAAMSVAEETGILSDRPPVETLSGRRILLVEDSLDTQRVVSWMLLDSGAEVAVAGDGKAALARVAASRKAGEPFDAVLMDMRLPVIDGYEATRQLRAEGFSAPIIALTSYAMTGDRERCIAAGCDDYVQKPIDREGLLETIRRRVFAAGA